MNQSTPNRLKRARLNPSDFLGELHQAIEADTKGGFGILVIQLNRTDRISALAQDATAMVVIRQAVERFEPLLKANDYYCVVAHDEIWVLLAELPSESVATLATAGFRTALKPVYSIQRSASVVRTVTMNPVIGAVLVPRGNTDALEVLHLMDETVKQARRSDSLTFIQRVTEEGSLGKRAQIEVELRQALFANELEVYYQPQVDLSERRCVSAEALIRWTRSNGKSVNAGLIASICEECGMIEHLTRFVLNNALRLQSTMRSRGLDIKISINLSAITLSDEDFPEIVLQSSQTWGVSPTCLVFEVTEGSLVENERAALRFMNRLRELGCEISIDDFGTGYSSLAYLKTYPFSELKIDRTFVEHLGTDESSIKLVRILADLSRTMGLRSVAEGVETDLSHNILSKLGVNLGQGYLYSRALPTSEFIEWATRYNQRAA
jgi:diguanylate cyclase